MRKAAPPLFNARIRPVEPKDFAFIRSLAAEFQSFTVPSEYILWFLTRFHPDYCRVLEDESGVLKAYLLAIPTSNPGNGIAIWQVAATKPDHAFALEYFAAYLRDLVERTEATSISFTTQNDSASLRLIRLLAKQFFGCDATQLHAVPTEQGEYEFRLSVGAAPSGPESGKKIGKTG
jgi:hypothetical protein